jgi:hypothetical protein
MTAIGVLEAKSGPDFPSGDVAKVVKADIMGWLSAPG